MNDNKSKEYLLGIRAFIILLRRESDLDQTNESYLNIQ